MNVTKPSVEIIDMKDYDEMIRKIEKSDVYATRAREILQRSLRNVLSAIF